MKDFTYRLENFEIIILLIMSLFLLIDYISNRKINASNSYFLKLDIHEVFKSSENSL